MAKKKEKVETVIEATTDTVIEVVEEVVETPKKVKVEPKQELPTHEGVRVIEVLEEKGDFLHCKMANGTTMHVPKSAFKGRN